MPFGCSRYYGHENVQIMNGGRAKWEQENRPVRRKKCPLTRRLPIRPKNRTPAIRAFRDDVFEQVKAKRAAGRRALAQGVFSGELLHMPNYPQEGATRGGHIPGAVSIPWSQATNEADSTFKIAGRTAPALRAARASLPTRRSSPTAGLASAARIPGSCSPTCWDIRRSKITTVPGPNGATWSERRSKSNEMKRDEQGGGRTTILLISCRSKCLH